MKIKKLLVIFFILFFFIIGILLRTNKSEILSAKYSISTSNLSSYYYSLTKKYCEEGKFLEKDSLRNYGVNFEENSPPLLHFFSCKTYFIFNVLFRLDLDVYLIYLPLFIYMLWYFIGIIFNKYYFKNNISQILFSSIFSLLPISVELTSLGNYTEEFLGAFFLFLFLISLLIFLKNNKKSSFILASLFLAFLSLIWQQFVFIYILLFILVLFSKKRFFYSLLILASITFSIAISFLLRNNFFALSMFGEFIYSVKNINNNHLINAMERFDWKSLSIYLMFQKYQLFGSILIFLTLIILFIKKDKKSNDIFILVFYSISFVLFLFMFKTKYLFFPIYLVCISSIDVFLIKKSVSFVLKNKLIIFFAIFLYFIAYNYSFFISGITYWSKKPLITLNSSIVSDKKDKLILKTTIVNNGGNQLNDIKSFSGIHIEYKDLELEKINVLYKKSKYQVVRNKKMNKDGYNFFEIKIYEFNKKNIFEVEYEFIKKSKSVPDVLLRVWVPNGYCSFINKIETYGLLVRNMGFLTNYWRNESCITRYPDNHNLKETCKVDAVAGYFDPIKFKCIKIYK